MEFPSKCPYCEKDNIEHCIGRAIDDYYDIEIHRCIHCRKPIFVIRKRQTSGSTDNWEIIHYYPTSNSVDLPKRIKELSPSAHTAYEQTIKANEQGFDMLVGAGLRISLEWLVWDYLIKVKGCEDSAIEKLSLAKRIALMSSNFYTEVCTRLVRLFGNDSVHIIKELNFSTDEVIEIFDMLCALIDGELQIKEVNDRLPKKS